jgi:hypothetical protein
MPTLFVIVPTFGKPWVPYDFATQDAVVRDLNSASLGSYTGAGGTEGFLAFGYRVADEAIAREAVARAMAKYLPGGEYHVRVGPDSGCNIAFGILGEFAPNKLSLRRADGRPLGSLNEVEALIRGLFPDVRFAWAPSGPERIRNCEERGHPLPNEIRQRLEGVPSVLEGVAEGEGYRVTFGLGHRDPVERLLVTPLGNGLELRSGMVALEAEAGAEFQASEEALRPNYDSS